MLDLNLVSFFLFQVGENPCQPGQSSPRGRGRRREFVVVGETFRAEELPGQCDGPGANAIIIKKYPKKWRF
jgi:hypothetical protein